MLCLWHEKLYSTGMNYYPLFMVWSWNNGMRCMSFYIMEESLWDIFQSWWRHQMETFSALLALYAGNSPVPVNSPHKGQWRGALMFSLICAWIIDWVNNREAGDLRRHRGHYDVSVMSNLQVGITTLEEDSCVIYDKPDDITATLARQRPNWPPGEREIMEMTSWWYETHRQTCNTSRTISQNLNVSRLVLLLSLPNPLKPGVQVENEDVFGAAPTGDALTTFECPTIVLPTKVHHVLEVWQCVLG